EGSELRRPSLPGLVRHELRPRVVHDPSVLAELRVVLGPDALREGQPHAVLQDLPHVLGAQAHPALRAHAARDALAERVHQPIDPWLDVPLPVELRADQTDAARDVEPDPSRRDDTAPARVGGGQATDGTAVAPVDVRHGEGGRHDAGEGRDVRHLLEGPVLGGPVDQLLGAEDDTRDPHGRFLRDPPDVRLDLLDGERHTSRYTRASYPSWISRTSS